MGASKDAPMMIAPTMRGDEANRSGTRGLAPIEKSLNRTIHSPASAAIPKKPATIDHASARPETGFARRRRRRADDVLCGQPEPPRYRQKIQRTPISAGTAQGIDGVVARFPYSNPPQMIAVAPIRTRARALKPR